MLRHVVEQYYCSPELHVSRSLVLLRIANGVEAEFGSVVLLRRFCIRAVPNCFMLLGTTQFPMFNRNISD